MLQQHSSCLESIASLVVEFAQLEQRLQELQLATAAAQKQKVTACKL